MRLLAISGSLRAGGSNTALLEAAALVAPEGIVVAPSPGIDTLPHFNPDLDEEGSTRVPAPVLAFRDAVGEAAGLLLSAPEYAHGLPGAFKNALDWLVSSPAFFDKPVAILSPGARGEFARAQLEETVRTMSGRLVPGASRVVALPRRGMTGAEIAADPALAGPLAEAVRALADAARG